MVEEAVVETKHILPSQLDFFSKWQERRNYSIHSIVFKT